MDMATFDSLTEVVISAFDDASKLVIRIRDQRKASDRALPEEPTRDLLDSLALGPVIVRGHFDHDFKRFGEQYACGDIQARESMKDVLISLQMTLIIALRSSGMDDVDLDFEALQTASDDCRVNAGVCLGQLSQRLSDAAKAQAMYPPNAMGYSSRQGLQPPMAPSLAYSSSRSTHSSNYGPRTPSDGMSERFATMSVSTVRPGRKMTAGSMGSDTQSPPPVNRAAALRNAPPDGFGRLPIQGGHSDADAIDALSMRRPSSHTLAPEDNDLLSGGDSPEDPPPRNPARAMSPPAQEVDRESFVSSAYSQNDSSSEMSRGPSSHQGASSRDRYGPEDYTPVADVRQLSNGALYDMYRPQSNNEAPPASYSTRAHDTNHSTLEHIRYLQQNARPPRHGINHFPMPPSSAPPKQAPPAPPSFQARQDSLNRPSSRQRTTTADQLSQFPYPKASPPPQQDQPYQVPLSRLNTRPFVSAPIPVHPSNSPPPRAPPPIPRVPTNHSNSSLSPPPQAPAPGVHHLNHTPSTHSNNSQTPSTPQSTHATLQPTSNSLTHAPSLLSQQARPGTALSILPTNVPLTLPTDKAPLVFCKSATRLFLSPTSDPKQSKSFSVANRPVGFNSMVPYWSCSKCNFEGPLCTIVNVAEGKKKKGKEEKIFDPKVRVSIGGGVRYRWVRLLSFPQKHT